MQLDLVHGRGDFTRGVAQQLFKMANLEVGYPDIPNFACVQQFLHLLPIEFRQQKGSHD